MQNTIAVRITAICALLAIAVVPVCAQDYVTQSVPRDAPYYTDLQRCYQLGLLVGYEDGTYRPDAILTRAELWVAFNRMLDLSRMQGLGLENDLCPVFATYARGVRDHWAIMAFERLLRVGIIDHRPMPDVRGFDEGIMRVEFAEVAVATMRAYGLMNADLSPAELAIGEDIMVRQTDGNFQMHEGMPRWEFAVAMNRLVNKFFPMG